MITPEEKVRQKLIAWLIQTRKVPEINFQLECTNQEDGILRADILIRKKNDWWLLVECKRQEEKFKEEHLDQIKRYLRHWPSKYVMWSNGIDVKLWESKAEVNVLREIGSLPVYNGI